MAFQPKFQVLGEYAKLLRFIKGQEKKFGVAVFFMMLSSVFEGVQLTALVPIVDRIFTNKQIEVPSSLPEPVQNLVTFLNETDPDKLFIALPIVFVILILIKNITVYIHSYIMNDIAQSVMRDMRSRIFGKIHSLSLDYFGQKRTGELISRITSDVSWIENAVSYAITDMFFQTFLIVVYAVWVFGIYPQGFFVVLILLPFVAGPIAIIGKRLRKLSKSTQEKMADINSHLIETISGVKVVKAFSMEAYEVGRFKGQNYDFYKLKMKSIKRTQLVSPITEFVAAVCGAGIIYTLGQAVREGEMSLGVFILFLGGFLAIIRPLKKLSNVHTIAQQALPADERINEILNLNPSVAEKPNAPALGPIRQSIVFEHVDFGYDADQLVLRDINLSINSGELVAIVGPTGTGKSTLVNLVPRFYDPSKGRVLIDGKDARDVSFASLRSQIGYVTQETILFNESVRYNITYGNFDVSEECMKEAATKAFADDFIRKMPEGYDTLIGDRGVRLSGGEKQRLTIARAIVKNPPVLILDEATSQLDSESEKFVQEALDKLMVGRTVIAIAHRLSTILKADKIVVMDQGRIIGCAPHDELLKTCPLYERLYKTQFDAS